MQPIAIRSRSWALRSGDRGIYVLESLPPNSTVSPYRKGSCTASTTSYLRGGAPRFEGDKPHFLYRSTDRDGGVHSRRASIQKPGGISQAHFPWASSLSETQPSRPRLSHGATDVYPRCANIPRLFACGQRPTQRLQKPECSMPVVGRFGDRTNCRRTHDSQHARVRCVSAARLSANPSFFRWQPT